MALLFRNCEKHTLLTVMHIRNLRSMTCLASKRTNNLVFYFDCWLEKYFNSIISCGIVFVFHAL